SSGRAKYCAAQYFVSLCVIPSNFQNAYAHPTDLGLRSLERLLLQRNKFLGSIPDSIGNLSWLGRIDLSQNQLSSTIPASVFNTDRLTKLNVSHNCFTGMLPTDVALLVSQNLSQQCKILSQHHISAPPFLCLIFPLFFLDKTCA
ncbi:hypothetical protein BAE44_0020457, partial [Dichanthelium oligosanthes]